MIKVRILDRCEHCEGDCYFPVGEFESYIGERYMRHEPCPQCNGVGRQSKWVSLHEFAYLLDKVIAMEPDYQEFAQEKPVSQYQNGRRTTKIRQRSEGILFPGNHIR